MATIFSAEKSLTSQTSDEAVEHEQEQEADEGRSSESYTEIISTLPREKGWTTEYMYQYQGFWYLSTTGVEGVMRVQKHFKARNEDILLATLPKSGTTWFKPLIFAIMNRGRCDFATHPVLTTSPHDLVPPLENYFHQNIAYPNLDSLSSPQLLFHTHISFTSLPQSVINSQGRIVYVCRNPKDVFVSTFYFLNRMADKNVEPLSVEEAFEQFCKGVSFYGPFWDHVLGYWKASLEWPERVLFMKYEDMKKDSPFHLKRLAEFMGCPFSSEEERQGVVHEILKLCSFENLSNLKVNNTGTFQLGTRKIGKHIFFRQGEVGDWRNHLTNDMVDRLNKIVEQKLSGSGLTFHDSVER
ncbi:hypothetical protein PVL29_022299 [Vitis rotundifolia]|uniref:Sulfotransferase n=1 Tax=Vitis rotundifolia TaxID=103349 RepID=A0AA38YVC3_VITRO|nr:hypothetical protein PVL29_022299 [Vitis rotundifolia]